LWTDMNAMRIVTPRSLDAVGPTIDVALFELG
jgi:hypothetical protein